ncbi:glycosyltransferase family 4 protein [Lyngbya confervoides]|uniref:Glycosyltransferase family 4 protein n=1 Tax=Lyngbya confervoides BDU141951 TaxID=1574623 RepID=A0ABD4T6E5_9CYAN|nr:glycosyltransferase family 1 protein [Lyngbya confervoides]MCM1984211.1 glycosyltransferase family 4 protein [Lyngbya confervoides BDU141951]
MQLFINGRFLTQQVTGVQRYARELVQAIDTLIAADELPNPFEAITVLVPPGTEISLSLSNLPIQAVGRWQGHLWEQIDLPRYSRGGLLVNLGNTAPLGKRDQVLTLHDVSIYAVPEAYSWAFRAWYGLLFHQLSRKVLRLLTVSQFSKREIAHHLGIPLDRVKVIYEGREHMQRISPDPSILRQAQLENQPFVLAVSSLSPHKNFRAVVQALPYLSDLSDLKVVIIGGRNRQVFAAADDLAQSQQIVRLGYIGDRQLKALYESAWGFIHASYYEGFGLTPLEAMVCGCPVLVSKAASMPEVCGDAALYFDPSDPQAIAHQVRRLFLNPALRAELRQKAMAQAQKFSWLTCARETWAVLQGLVP